MDIVNGMRGKDGEAAARKGRRKRRREGMALWPFMILQCVSAMIGMAQGRLLLIELMMPPPEPPILPPEPPIIEPPWPDFCDQEPQAMGCPDGPEIQPPRPIDWSSEIRRNDPDYIAIPDSMEIPEELPASDTSSVEIEYELTPPKDDEELPEMDLDDVDYEDLPEVQNGDEVTVLDEMEEPEVDKERGRRKGRLARARRKYRTLTG